MAEEIVDPPQPFGPGNPPVNTEVPENGDDEDGEDSEARG